MPQPAYPRDSGEKNQDVEEGVFWGLTKSASPHCSQVFLAAMEMKENSPWKEQKPPLETLTETPPKIGRLARVRCVVFCASVEWAASGLCVAAQH